MNPRRAVLLALVFPVIAVLYWAAQIALGGTVDFAGVTMLIALGAATALMAYVLFSGLARS
jgi:ammonia channel protein AmtB